MADSIYPTNSLLYNLPFIVLGIWFEDMSFPLLGKNWDFNSLDCSHAGHATKSPVNVNLQGFTNVPGGTLLTGAVIYEHSSVP